jgi:hypothetical protein
MKCRRLVRVSNPAPSKSLTDARGGVEGLPSAASIACFSGRSPARPIADNPIGANHSLQGRGSMV